MKTQDILCSMFIFAGIILVSSCGPHTTIDKPTDTYINYASADSQTYILKDTTVKVLWHGKKSNDTTSKTIVNNDYLDTMSNPERAALCFVSEFVSSDSGINMNCSNAAPQLKSLSVAERKLVEKKLNFVKQWFRYDKKCLDKLEDSSAFYNSKKEFEEINLTVKNDTIKVLFTANEIIPGRTARWRQEDTFKLDQNNLHLIEEKQSKIN